MHKFLLLPLLLVTNLWAIPTEGVPIDSSVNTEDSNVLTPPQMHQVGSIFSGNTDHSTPNMDIIPDSVLGPVDLSDLEMTLYKTVLSIQDTEQRQGLPPGTLVNKYLAAWEAERNKSAEMAVRLGESIARCPDGYYYVTDFPDGSPLCAPAATLQEMENHRFSCAVNVWEHTFALDFLFKSKGREGYPIYDYWTYYAQPPFHTCPYPGTVWGAGEFCNMFPTYEAAAIDHWHCNEYLRQLKDLYEKETIVFEKECSDKGWSNGNIWKPKSDTRKGEGVVLLEKRYCDGKGGPAISNFRIEDALGAKVADSYFNICNSSNGGRLHERFKPDGASLSGPVFVRYDFNGVEECRKVPDPSKRED